MIASAPSSPARRGHQDGLVDVIPRPRFMHTLLVFFFACLALQAWTMPALALQCASPPEIAASRTRWAGVRKQFVNTTDHAMACRVFAASFYESVLTRHAAVACARDAERDPDISALDSEINAFNDLLAAKCGS
jgi:hypothetical protein